MPRKKDKAKHQSNQSLVDKLIDISNKPQYLNNANYSCMFRRAIASLVAHPEPVTNREEAKALKGIGEFTAKKMFPLLEQNKLSQTTNVKKRKNICNDDSHASDELSNQGNCPLEKNSSFISLKPNIPSHEEAEKFLKLLKGRKSKYQLDAVTYAHSEKHFNYLRATEFGAQLEIDDFTNWRVVLLLDLRENNRDDVQSKLQQSGM